MGKQGGAAPHSQDFLVAFNWILLFSFLVMYVLYSRYRVQYGVQYIVDSLGLLALRYSKVASCA